VSPDPVAVKVTAVPAVPVVGPEMVTVSGVPGTEMVADALAVAAFASVTVTLTV
jgi:hypothetical protein